MKKVFLFGLLLSFACTVKKSPALDQAPTPDPPTLSLTFDDGITTDMPGYPFETWNALLLEHLENQHLKAVFFVTGGNKTDEKGRFLLQSWNTAGHRIANHTYTHPNYNSADVSFEDFRMQFLRTDSVISGYSRYLKLFRFPYLKEGNTPEKIERFRALLKDRGYRNGYVTIDASDWAIDSRLRKKLRENPHADLAPYREFYLRHLYDRATYYEGLAQQLTGRHIRHTLLLHHNLASALFLEDLITMFRAKGWALIDADRAFEDEIFRSLPANVPAGESLVWALAKQSGRYAGQLRYPAEDERYEKEAMDASGL